MHIPRIYISQDLIVGEKLSLPEDSSHHIQHVLRLKAGDKLRLFNGQGGEHPSNIIGASRHRVEVHIGELIVTDCESSLDITLGISILKRDAMSAALQRATELGVSKIIPVITANSAVSNKQVQKREQQWRLIVQSSCEQSGRDQLPSITGAYTFDKWLEKTSGHDLNLLASLSSSHRLSEIDAKPESIGLLIGPEGGLTADEETRAIGSGFAAIRFGGRILRAETAPAALLSLLQYRWGDY